MQSKTSSKKRDKVMFMRLLGIFWEIENFLINKYFDNCIEYQFCCACHSKLLDDSITESIF